MEGEFDRRLAKDVPIQFGAQVTDWPYLQGMMTFGPTPIDGSTMKIRR
jgi:hypothetical protein